MVGVIPGLRGYFSFPDAEDRREASDLGGKVRVMRARYLSPSRSTNRAGLLVHVSDVMG